MLMINLSLFQARVQEFVRGFLLFNFSGGGGGGVQLRNSLENDIFD